MSAECPLCGSPNVALVSHHSDFTDASIYWCERSAHWFAYPEPSADQLARLYADTYSDRRSRRFGPEYYALMQRRAEAQVRFIEDHAGSVADLRVVDVGCGIGALVQVLTARGANAAGFDLDPASINVGRRLWKANVQVGSPAADSLGGYDLVCLSHVVEHLPHLESSLGGIVQLARSRGWVFVEVPLCSAATFAENHDTESHLHFFTPSSLRTALECVGLRVVSLRTCGPTAEDLARYTPPRKLEVLLRSALRRFHLDLGGIRTPYDHFFDRYFDDDRGMWIRALARRP